MSNITYVRWQRGQSRRLRVFPGLALDHPSYNSPCVLCPYSLGSDIEGVQLVAVGPDDAEHEAKHEAGKWYSALAVVVHTSCLAKLDDTELDRVVRELAISHRESGPPR